VVGGLNLSGTNALAYFILDNGGKKFDNTAGQPQQPRTPESERENFAAKQPLFVVIVVLRNF
jgi:hypothetical protein